MIRERLSRRLKIYDLKIDTQFVGSRESGVSFVYKIMPPLPSNAFSLAAIVRSSKTQTRNNDHNQQQYVLVHEKYPRGWWLPGGGMEYKDSTPVDAAVRETMEEAAAPNCNEVPIMTHLLSLEQSPGRIRFIFRGEWSDDNNTYLKCAPGDDESIEAKWVTWDELNKFNRRRRRHGQRTNDDSDNQLSSTMIVSHPWLRGHEPLTFFGMLEKSQQNNSVPGLEVLDLDDQKNVVGAYFSQLDAYHQSTEGEVVQNLTGGRDTFLINLHCRLFIYDRENQHFAVLSKTIDNQYEQTLRQVTNELISHFSSSLLESGLLRIEYTSENENESTLTVFPYAIISSNLDSSIDIAWASKDDLTDSLDRKLAAILTRGKGNLADLNILKDTE